MRQFCLAAEDQEGSANITCENTFKSVKTEESAIHLCAYPEEPSVAVAFQFIILQLLLLLLQKRSWRF